MWGKKTPVKSKDYDEFLNEDEEGEERYENNVEKTQMKIEIDLLRAQLHEKEQERIGFIKRFDEQNAFLQKVIMELINRPAMSVPAMVPARQALVDRLAEKRTSELSTKELNKLDNGSTAGPAGRLP